MRLFQISAEDGLPDRIHKYPGSTEADVSKRIEGALSLGKLISKKETTQQVGMNNEVLEIENLVDLHLERNSEEEVHGHYRITRQNDAENEKIVIKHCFFSRPNYLPKTYLEYLKAKRQLRFKLTIFQEFKLVIKSLTFFKTAANR